MKRKKHGMAPGQYKRTELCSTALGHHVIYHKRTHLKEALLSYGSNVHDSDAVQSALYTAQQQLNKQLFIALEKKKVPLIARLLKQGADVNAIQGGLAPLHIAIMQTNTELVAFLLTHGANVNTVGPYKNTPLHMAVLQATPEEFDIIELLLIAGANVNVQNELGQTPLHFHKHIPKPLYRDIAKCLLKAGAHIHTLDIKGNRPFDTLSPSVRNELIQFALNARFGR